MAKILPIVLSPDPLLKKISQKVEKIDAKLQELMDNMLATMYYESGIGLAAIQVGVLKRVLVIDINYQKKEKCHDHHCGESHINNSNPLFLVNPEIIEKSLELWSYKEACLSFPIPEAYGDIVRPKKVSVKFLDYHGNEQIMEMENLLSTCVQHEIDHLNGITFIDHLSKLKNEIIIKKMKKLQSIKN
jgi:peptide deformylase